MSLMKKLRSIKKDYNDIKKNCMDKIVGMQISQCKKLCKGIYREWNTPLCCNYYSHKDGNNTCHYQKKDLKLSDRKWTCPKCGTNHIRDVNAAINLKHYVPKELRELRSVEVVESLASQALFNSEASLEQPKKQKLIAVRRKKKVPHL